VGTSLTKEQAISFKRRWELVRAREISELRATPIELKLRQLASLMASVRELGWDERLAEDERAVWSRWKRLREARG